MLARKSSKASSPKGEAGETANNRGEGSQEPDRRPCHLDMEGLTFLTPHLTRLASGFCLLSISP
jgi:hypothetical protein